MNILIICVWWEETNGRYVAWSVVFPWPTVLVTLCQQLTTNNGWRFFFSPPFVRCERAQPVLTLAITGKNVQARKAVQFNLPPRARGDGTYNRMYGCFIGSNIRMFDLMSILTCMPPTPDDSPAQHLQYGTHDTVY